MEINLPLSGEDIHGVPAKSQFLQTYLKKFWAFFRLPAEKDSFCSASFIDLVQSSMSSDRVRNRTPRGASAENPPPLPGTTSMMSRVCFQYSYCCSLM